MSYFLSRWSLIYLLSAAFSFPAYTADPSDIAVSAVKMSSNSNTHRRKMVLRTAEQMSALRTALTNYYAENGAWPPNLTQLSAEGHYLGELTTPYGTISGNNSGTNFNLSLELPEGAQAPVITKMIASQSAGEANNNQLSLSVSPPSTFAIAATMLCRKQNPDDPNCATMEQNLNMANHSILDVLEIESDSVKAQVIDTKSLNVSEDLKIERDLDLVRDIKVGRDIDIAGDINITKTITVDGSAALNELTVSELAQFKKGIKVDTTAVFGGEVDITNGLKAKSANVQQLVVSGTTNLKNVELDQLDVNLNAYIKGQLRVGSQLIEGDSQFKGSIDVEKNVTIKGLLSVTGVTTGGAIYANGGLFAGNKRIVSNDGKTLYENLKPLKDVYLGISAKAADANKLDGYDSTAFAIRGNTNTFTKSNIFNGGITGSTASFSTLKSTNSIYEKGKTLQARYLGITATAANANKLDNIDSSQFARLDLSTRFKKNVTVDGTVTASNVYAAGNKGLKEAYDNALSAKSQASTNKTAIAALVSWRSACKIYGTADTRCNIKTPPRTTGCTPGSTSSAPNFACRVGSVVCEPGIKTRQCLTNRTWGGYVVVSHPYCINRGRANCP